MIAGVDEAGRGPIIGPMVMAAVMIESDDELPSGLKDSKLLTPARRKALYKHLIKLRHEIAVVPVQEIDAWVNQGKLNWLEAEHTAKMIDALCATDAIIDCPARNLKAYEAFLVSKCPDCAFTVQFKADLEHPVVAAASILAKVTRDRIIEELKEELGFDFGSGYLTDPKTQRYLKEAFDPDYPHIRTSWQPYKDLVAKRQQRTLL